MTDIAYILNFRPDLAPAWLDHVALLSGFEPPTRDRGFAWCDLGCGQGVTAAILAATHSAGRFYGIDGMPAHIDHARRLGTDCAIENLDFHAADFATAVDIDFAGFDYIVAAGVYSWIDENAQADLRRFIDRHLKPGGLVYLSYYSMPGRAPDLPFQRLVRALGRTLPGDSGAASAAAINIVRRFAELKAPALVRSPMAKWLNPPQQVERGYLAHEFMVENWEPLCVTDVRAAMRSIGLAPAGSAALIENHYSRLLDQAARDALATIEDDDAREFARDFLLDQAFRRDVYIRKGRRLDDEERRARLFNTPFMLARPATFIEYSVTTPAGSLKFDTAEARRIITAFAAGPRFLADVVSKPASAPQETLDTALMLAAAGALRPVEPTRASVERLNQTICRRLGGGEAILTLALPCGTALTVNDLVRRGATAETVGQKNDWAEWQQLLSVHGLGAT